MERGGCGEGNRGATLSEGGGGVPGDGGIGKCEETGERDTGHRGCGMGEGSAAYLLRL